MNPDSNTFERCTILLKYIFYHYFIVAFILRQNLTVCSVMSVTFCIYSWQIFASKLWRDIFFFILNYLWEFHTQLLYLYIYFISTSISPHFPFSPNPFQVHDDFLIIIVTYTHAHEYTHIHVNTACWVYLLLLFWICV